MLVKFKVRNYLSFKDEVEFDFSAESLKEKQDYVHVPYLHNPKLALLKSAVVYGYNSYGKSNLIKAYSAFINFVLHSFNFGNNNLVLKTEPFRLNSSTVNEPSTFEALFIIRNTKYRYGFEISNEKVVSEWLYYADGPIRENPLFFRADLEFRDISKLWNKSSQNKVEQSRIFTKSRNLFLSVMLSQEGIPRIDEIAKWFEGNIVLNGNYGLSIKESASIYASEEFRGIILRFLENAELGFTSVFEKISNLISEKGIHSDIANALLDIEKENFDLYTHHEMYDKHGAFQKMVEFHLQKNESSGSIKYFIVSCFLAKAIKNGQLILIDELDASLHTNLLLF